MIKAHNCSLNKSWKVEVEAMSRNAEWTSTHRLDNMPTVNLSSERTIKGLLEPAHSWNSQFALIYPASKILVTLSPPLFWTLDQSFWSSIFLLGSEIPEGQSHFGDLSSSCPLEQEWSRKMRDPDKEVAREWERTGREEQKSDIPLYGGWVLSGITYCCSIVPWTSKRHKPFWTIGQPMSAMIGRWLPLETIDQSKAGTIWFCRVSKLDKW